jgi:hypothetical protein
VIFGFPFRLFQYFSAIPTFIFARGFLALPSPRVCSVSVSLVAF